MTDDPRTEPLAKALFEQTRPSWSWDCPPRNHHVAQDYWRAQAAALLSEALDPADPLRALLADGDRAVEFAAKARYEAWRATWLTDGGSMLLTPPWEDIAEVMQRHWRAETDHACSAVLAALREVAGL